MLVAILDLLAEPDDFVFESKHVASGGERWEPGEVAEEDNEVEENDRANDRPSETRGYPHET